MGMVKCYSCKGTKKLLALGNLIKDCPTCSAVGYITSKDDIMLKPISPFKTNEAISIPVKIKQKPGRKTKSIDTLNC